MQPIQYAGNQDYRGWLNADPSRQWALGYVGNDGGINKTALQNSVISSGALQTDAPSIYQNKTAQLNDYFTQYNSLLNQPGPTGTPTNVASGGASGANTNPDFINQAYNTKIAGLRSVFDTLNPQQDAATLNVNNQYQNQSNSLQGQLAIGQRNLGLAGQQVQDSKAKSLDDLKRQVQTQGMSYQNQLGAYGAGDSSANGLIQQALSGMASRNRGNVLENAGQQQQGIDLQGQDLNTEFQNNLKSLDDWKSSSLNDIATKFLQQKQAIQTQMQSADADRYQALAQADASYTQRAIQQLAQLEGIYKQNATDLVTQYQQIQGPNAQINPALQQFAVKSITPGQIGQLGQLPGVSTNTDPTPLAVRRNFQDEYGFGLGA